MTELIVRIEREGITIPVGCITGNDASDAVFQYDPSYIKEVGIPISVSLPLQEEEFSPFRTAAFFEGLLPEGFTRKTIAQWMQVEEGDYLTILHGLGRECLGAVSIMTPDERMDASYERITDDQMLRLAEEGAASSSELIVKTHLSLTGASGKVGLYYDEPSRLWYLPHGTAPSTHIVKQSHVRLDAIVTNEQLCLMTARRCGLDTPESFIIETDSGRGETSLFATKRYDRSFKKTAEKISGLPKPDRLHQEDFAQSLGIPSSAKYEPEGSQYLKDVFLLLRRVSSNPMEDMMKLWKDIIFQYLIGNTDAHIKNYSLVYDARLTQIRLSPVYDVISTIIYKQSTRRMAFGIGGISDISDITTDAFRRASSDAGLGERMAMETYDEILEQFRNALHTSALELAESGFSKALELERRILENHPLYGN